MAINSGPLSFSALGTLFSISNPISASAILANKTGSTKPYKLSDIYGVAPGGGGGGGGGTPSVFSISPTSGPASGGTVVTITGTGLTGALLVAIQCFGFRIITVTSNTDTEIIGTTPNTGLFGASVPATGTVFVAPQSGPPIDASSVQFTFT